ncbi:IS1167, transposase [Streptococcus pneumoniae]|nr:IS1167, transposase [Streptococcus pneumoniae]
MEQLHFITKLLDIKDPNIKILDIINMDTHKEIIAKLDYEAPSCPDCGSLMKKYDFQKPSKIPYLETTGMPTRILLRKRRFKCYHCSKMMVAETSIVKKNHQIPRIINQKIAQKLIEKISMTDIAHQLSISTSTVIRKLNDFHFKHDFSCLPEIMSWDEYAFTKGKMSFIAYRYYGAYFVVEKKSHMTYNEKRPNNSLERFIWNNYILSQNCSILKTQTSRF